MAFKRGRFGIEYDSRRPDDDSSLAGWIFIAIVLAAAAVLVAAGVRRFRASIAEPPPSAPPSPGAETSSPSETNAPEATPPPTREIESAAAGARSQVARNLLLKLEKAEVAHDVELAVSAIEQLRALPGEAVADIDDRLARRLGELNVKRLFAGKNPQWVKEVNVRRGDSASRIAVENGSTFASLLALNELPSADRLRIGQKLNVMDHPKFTLVVHRAAKYADLSLKGKFFKRYDIVEPVRAPEGSYETTAKLRAFLAETGVVFSPEDRAQLEMLLPARTPMLVSER